MSENEKLSRKKLIGRMSSIDLDPGDKLWKKPLRRDEKRSVGGRSKEDRMIDMIDRKRSIEKLLAWEERITSGKQDVSNFFSGLAPEAAMELASLMFDNHVAPKVKLDAVNSFLDRAGYSKINKHAVAAVDGTQSKAALISLLMGANQALKQEGIEIIDDSTDDDQDKEE